MSKVKTLVSIAVAGALSWSFSAAAVMTSPTHESTHADAFAHARWHAHHPRDVHTPFSPSETPFAALHAGRHLAASVQTDHVVLTPFSPSGTSMSAWQRPRRARSLENMYAKVSLPNPQTPWSPNETGGSGYRQALRAHAEQVAEIEQARLDVVPSETALASTDGADSQGKGRPPAPRID